MMNAQGTGSSSENLGALPGELPIQPDSTALMISFLLTHDILAAFLDYPPML